MAAEIRVGVIGLDTSHAIEFPRRMQASECPQGDRVEGLRAVTCLRFETPFQDRRGLDARQAQLEGWGVRVTESFDEAVAGCDALMLEINDPSLHLPYFRRCAGLGKPIFLDKPLADAMAGGREILSIARRNGTRFFSASSLRCSKTLEEACRAVPRPRLCSVYGFLGEAPVGSSIVWYGVHAFEMLERALGRGATVVLTRRDRLGAVELAEGSWQYGGLLRSAEEAHPFAVDGSTLYTDLLKRVKSFFAGCEPPVGVEVESPLVGNLAHVARAAKGVLR